MLDTMSKDTKKYIRHIVSIRVYIYIFSNQGLLGSMVGKTLGEHWKGPKKNILLRQ